MNTAIEMLKEEHEIIKRMLNVLDEASQKLEDGKNVIDVFKSSLDFIRNFSDRCHHGKEEDGLFPILEKHGIPKEGGPIGMMLIEHDEGRRFVKGMADAIAQYDNGDKTKKKDIVDNARNYVQLLRDHIPKENDILYPIAEEVIPEEEQENLEEKFEEIERERIGEGKHHEYIHLIEELEKSVGIESPKSFSSH